MRDEATVDRIFAGDLDGLPNLSSRVGNILDFDVDPYSMGDLKHPLDLDHSVGVGGSLTTPSTSFCCCTWKTINQCMNTGQVVRIFTSSTFTDMLMERNCLMEYVYPKIKEYCREKHGLEYQVISD